MPTTAVRSAARNDVGFQGVSDAAYADWKIGRELGRGAVASVHEAWPAVNVQRLPAPYVLKLLRIQGERTLGQFAQEAALGTRLSSPHLLPIIAAELEAPPYYMVMPRIEGETLAARLQHGDPLSAPEALWIIHQLTETIRTLADAGWIHGDLTPQNVHISPAGHVTLLDLGLAQPLRRRGTPDVTQLAGTPAYLAPEVLAGYRWPDVWSEIYSLGLVLLECLSGQHAEYERRRESLSPLRIRAMLGGGFDSLAELLSDMLSRQPLKRPLPDELLGRLTALEVETFASWR